MSYDTFNTHQYKHITSNGVTQVFVGSCILTSIVVNTPGVGTIKVEDSDGTTTVGTVAVLANSVAALAYEYKVSMTRGIKVTTNVGGMDITVIYKK